MKTTEILNSLLYPTLVMLLNIFGLRVCSKNRWVKIGKRTLCRRTKIVSRGKDNVITIGDGCRFRNLYIKVDGEDNSISIGSSVMVYVHCYLFIKGNNNHATIADKTTIGDVSFFAEESNTSIWIGEDRMFGRRISICTTNFHSIINNVSRRRMNPAKDIIIGNHVWIGSKVDINKGVVLMDNTIVSSGSVVTKPFNESNIILAGIPTQKVKESVNWTRHKI